MKPVRLKMGAEARAGGVFFRVWAPKRRRVEVVVENAILTTRDPQPQVVFPLRREKDGYFGAFVRGLGPGTLYRYRLDRREDFPDPCSRFQPQGPHGPSLVVDPRAHAWRDS
ncbi:MAG: malto-oligosyltrehalose trehalohydrolase, partial [Verrucomicrobiae bacterium]|nr:malto-oligosyltrehalose trehalohydrolase [Verrucomicrobiae bacterium]